MAGIFFKDYISSSYIFKPFNGASPPPPPLCDPSFFSVPHLSVVCSSSKGLLLCFNFHSNNYHVFNPFIHNASTSYKKIPSPPRVHAHFTPVVISVLEEDQEVDGAAAFCIICAIHEGNSRYTFDWYYSATDEWYSKKGSIDISPSLRIREETGVSNDIGMAFWLTDDPKAVIRFNTACNSSLRIDLEEIPCRLPTSPLMQLGKISKTNVGLVAADGRIVRLYVLENRSDEKLGPNSWWRQLGFLNMNQAGVACGIRWPGLLRFDKDVPLWMGSDQFNLLEVNPDENVRLQQLYPWEIIPSPVYDTVPYVCSDKNPGRVLSQTRSK